MALPRALIGALGRDSELISGCWVAMHDAAGRLLAHAQRAGVLRTDVSADDVLRLLHGIVVTTEQEPEQTDRLVSLMSTGFVHRDRIPPGEAGICPDSEDERRHEWSRGTDELCGGEGQQGYGE
jgi:hypothetical protein